MGGAFLGGVLGEKGAIRCFWVSKGAFWVENGKVSVRVGKGGDFGWLYILILDLYGGHVSCFKGWAMDTVYCN